MPKVPKETRKRKKVVFTIQQKLELLNKLKAGQTAMSNTHEYDIGNATVTDIRKEGPQLRQFTQIDVRILLTVCLFKPYSSHTRDTDTPD